MLVQRLQTSSIAGPSERCLIYSVLNFEHLCVQSQECKGLPLLKGKVGVSPTFLFSKLQYVGGFKLRVL